MSFERLARSLTAKAATLVRAQAERRHAQPHRWYSGRLLWPLFTSRKR